MKNKVLVTGGTGFVGLQIISQLLEKNYEVRTTIRSSKRKERILKVLSDNKTKNIANLSFAEADLSKDEGWKEAMKNQEYVLSVASPVFFDKPKNENDAIRPALEGITRILENAQATGVKRVVMTSNFGAVGFSKKARAGVVTTEDDWTDENTRGLSIYEKSKLLAEKAAWNYIKRPEVTLEFVTVNPVAIFGPSLDNHVSGSFDLLKDLVSGSIKRVPNMSLNIIDVRDVADIHIRAMETSEANGHRFIATEDGEISMREIATLIQEKRPEVAAKISNKDIPNWLVEIGSLFNEKAKSGKLFKDMNRNVSNESAKMILGWEPKTNNDQVILDSIDSMIKYKII